MNQGHSTPNGGGKSSRRRYAEPEETQTMVEVSAGVARDIAAELLQIDPESTLGMRANALFIELRRPLIGLPLRRDSLLRILSGPTAEVVMR
ncbi:MAG: hypothetical protein HYX73_10835 [Acidobacteria bacterium]|nr:hypothetical protein [Acidobacteriota bacterium]